MVDTTKVYMIGNSHIDPVWLWLWPEGVEATRATFRSALDRMGETEEFIFSGGQAAIYEWIEKTDPSMFQEIKKRISEGRWVIVNGWWMQPDCNLPSGESFIRQALHGQGYFKEKFGVKARVAYNVDSFGHAGMLPQILVKCGFTSYVFMRPDKNENPDVPNLFVWESPDGSGITTYKIPVAYQLGHQTPELVEERIRESARNAANPTGLVMAFYGVGNHGGGPTKAQISAIQGLIGSGYKPEPVFGSPNDFFDHVESLTASGIELPVHKGDLQHHASGCYSVQSEIKRNNRRAESNLAIAEKLSSLASSIVEYEYPHASLRKAWSATLFNQFHDILAGTSFPQAYEDARNLHGSALQSAREATTYAVQSIASRIDTRWPNGHEVTVIVYNPHSWDVSAPVDISYQFGIGWKSLQDENGKIIDIQATSNQSTVTNRGMSTFVADVPAMGYRTFRCLYEQRPFASSRKLVAEGARLENDWLSLEFDPSTGHLVSMTDKTAGLELLSGAGAVAKVMDDPSDTWSHDVFKFDKYLGSFGDAKIELLENGPVRASISVQSVYGKSRLTQEFMMYRDLPGVEVRVSLDWQENYKLLKICFPVNCANGQASYEMPFGHIVKPANWEEEPMHSWVDLTGDSGACGSVLAGLTVVNDSKYSCSVNGNEIAMTVLRSPAYAHHEPGVIEPGKKYLYIDQGVQSFTYRLMPHCGPLDPGAAIRAGEELNQPVVALVESNHPGDLPLVMKGVEINADNIVISAIKRSDDDRGYVVRAYETQGKPAAVEISAVMLAAKWTSNFEPFEVKTWLLPDDEPGVVAECNMIEEIL